MIGKVVVAATVANLSGLHHFETGTIGAERIRRVEVSDALVDTGATTLELLDFVVDPPGQRLIGNPAHGGEHMIEIY